jgi:hypothetical protein
MAAYRRRTVSVTSRSDVPLPFRWDLSRIEGLGKFLEQDNCGPVAKQQFQRDCEASYEGFFDDLLSCAARTVAVSGDVDFVFIGRSPESLFDLLSGLWSGTRCHERLAMLHFSTGRTNLHAMRCDRPHELLAFRAYLDTLGLSPQKLIHRERPVALVDLVWTGHSMEELLGLLSLWAKEQNADWSAMTRNLRLVAIINNNDADPPLTLWDRQRNRGSCAGKWYSDRAECRAMHGRGQVREVAVPSQLWEFLGDWQAKVTPSYPPTLWGSPKAARPCHAFEHLEGLRAAHALYEAGCLSRVRAQFVRRLADDDVAMREPWCRAMLGDL